MEGRKVKWRGIWEGRGEEGGRTSSDSMTTPIPAHPPTLQDQQTSHGVPVLGEKERH